MSFYIKKLAATDVAQAKDLFLFFQIDDGVAEPLIPTDAYLEKLLAKDDFVVLVALQEEEVIGGLTAYELPMYKESKPEYFLYEIAVAPAHRQQGIARALIETLKKLAVEKGMEEMYVGTEMDNMPAQNLYASTGGKRENIAWYVYPLHTT